MGADVVETRPHDPPWFEVVIDLSEDTAHLRLLGELDLATVDRLAQVVYEVTATHRGTLELDLAGLKFCDASGLRGLHQAQRVARAGGSTMVITNVPALIRRLIEITGLEQVLDLR